MEQTFVPSLVLNQNAAANQHMSINIRPIQKDVQCAIVLKENWKKVFIIYFKHKLLF